MPSPSPSPPLPPPEDDPSSELNVLRRELREHQAQLRDAAQQLSAQADDLLDVRRALSAAERDLEDALAREARLRAQLHAQALRRQLVDHTMAAAESLVASLKDMALDTDHEHRHHPPPPAHLTLHPPRDDPHPHIRSRHTPAAHPHPALAAAPHPLHPARTAPAPRFRGHPSVSPFPPPTSPQPPPTSQPELRAMSKLDAVLQTIQDHPTSAHPAAEGDAEGDTAPLSPPSPDPATTSKLDAVLQTIEERPASAPASDPAAGREAAPLSPPSADPASVATSKVDIELHTLHEQPASAPHAPAGEEAAVAPALATTPVAGSPRQAQSGKARARSRTRQTSNLLATAFRLRSSGEDGDAAAAASAAVAMQTGVDGESSTGTTGLPEEVAAVVKSEGVPQQATYQPRRIATCVGDAHSGEIFALAMSEDGELAVSGGDDRVIRVYGRGGAAHSSITEGVRTVTALAVGIGDADGRATIWNGSSDGSLRAFRPHARRKGRWSTGVVLYAHEGVVRRVVVVGRGEGVVTCGMDRRVVEWDATTGARTWEVRAASAALDADVLPSGMVVSAHKDGAVRLWDRSGGGSGGTGGLVGGAKVHGKAATWVRGLDDGAGVVSLGRDGAVRLLDVRMNVGIVREMHGGVGVSSDWHRAAVCGRLVACGTGRAGVVGVWDVDRGDTLWKGAGDALAEPDVLDLVARRWRNTGGVLVPVWQRGGAFAAASKTRQVAFWECA